MGFSQVCASVEKQKWSYVLEPFKSIGRPYVATSTDGKRLLQAFRWG